MITKRYLNAGLNGENGYADTEAFVGFTTAYDPASNKKYERHLHAELRSHLYPAQDSLDRLRQYQRGTLQQDSNGHVTVATPVTLPGTDTDRTYDLDGLGNWRRTAYTPVGGAETTEVRQHNYLNQVTRFDSTPVLYDHGNNAVSADPDVARRGNGNIADDGVRLYAYDAFNRLKEVRRKSDGVLIAAYTYDALGRRIRKVVSSGGLTGDIPNGTTDYLYSGVQCVEERNPLGGGGSTDTPLRQYVWGRYVDELVQQKDKGAPDTDYYLLSDLLYRSVAVVDDDKAIVEAYDTDAYGNTLIFDQPGTAGNWFASNAHRTNAPKCRFIFTGREYDAETQVYFYRARYYYQELGRLGSRDPVRGASAANVYVYVIDNPLVFVDPYGLQHLGKTNLHLLATHSLQGVSHYNKTPWWTPGVKPSVKSRAAAYCGEGIQGEGITQAIGDLGWGVMTAPLKTLLPGWLQKAIAAYDAGKQIYEETIKDALAEYQFVEKRIAGPGKCYCNMWLIYHKTDATFVGMIEGFVGEEVNRFGICTKCCVPDRFSYRFSGKAKIERVGLPLLKSDAVTGVEQFRF